MDPTRNDPAGAMLANTVMKAQRFLTKSSQRAQQFLEGLLQEMEPAWRELQGFMDAMGPAMIELMDEVQDWSAYEPPEILDNGDIIIRRKPQVPDTEAGPDQEQPPQIEL